MSEGETIIDGHTVDWMENEDDPGRIGVWVDSEPIGSFWMTSKGTWMAEHWDPGSGGFASEEATADDAIKALYEHWKSRQP